MFEAGVVNIVQFEIKLVGGGSRGYGETCLGKQQLRTGHCAGKSLTGASNAIGAFLFYPWRKGTPRNEATVGL